MIIYKCLVSGDEMFSDIYKISVTEDGLFYEVEGKHVSRKVGEIDDMLIGANASAEEAQDSTDTSVESGVDIVLNHKLTQTPSFTKKSFVEYLKAYMKALKAKMMETKPDDVAAFQQEATNAGKKMVELVSKNKNLEFFTGENMHPEGIVGFLDYRSDGQTPYFLFLKCGLEQEKC